MNLEGILIRTQSGHKVLLLEARDRIGGRTYTSVIEGYPYEMGGTWLHWGQPHVWTELSKYGLVDQLEDSAEGLPGVQHSTSYYFEHGKRTVSLAEDVSDWHIFLGGTGELQSHL